MNDISQLEFEISLITDDFIKDLVVYLLKNRVPNYFFEVTASSSGKYHAKDKDGNPITLVGHTKFATRMLEMLLNHPMLMCKFSEYQKNIMRASIICHDTVKRGYPSDSGSTVHRHPIMVSLLIDSTIENDPLKKKMFTDMVEIISAHHGPWNRSNYDEYVLPTPYNEMQYYVHIADYLGSRNYLSCNLDDSDEMKMFLR